MAVLSDDERAILAVFAEAAEPLGWGDVVESLLPPRPRGPRRGGKRTWALRWEEMVRTAMELYKAGLLAELPTGPADMTVITDAGREALWGPKPSGWITTDAVLSQEEFEAWRQEREKRLQAKRERESADREAEADADKVAGLVERFDSDEAFLASFEEPTPGAPR